MASGLRKISSKTSNDTIVLADKLGSDQTGLTTSDGPKQNFSSEHFQSNTLLMLSGRNNDSYDRTDRIYSRNTTGVVALVGYGVSKPVVTTTSYTADALIRVFSGGGDSQQAQTVLLSNIDISGNEITSVFDCTVSAVGVDQNTTIITDRCVFRDANGNTVFAIAQGNSSHYVHWLDYGSDIQNYRTNVFNYTVDTALIDESSFTVKEAINTSQPTEGFFEIGGDPYHYGSWSGSTFNVESNGRSLPPDLAKTYAENSPVITGDNKSNIVYVSLYSVA